MKKNRKEDVDEELKQLISNIHEAEIDMLPQKEELEATYQLSDVFYHRMNRLIQKVSQKEKHREYGKYIAAAVAVMALLFSVANPQYLVEAKNKVMEWFDDHASFQFSNDSEVNVIPHYALGYVPEGYELVLDEYHENSGLIIYENGTDTLSFFYGVSDSDINVNNENTTYILLEDKDGIALHYFAAQGKGKESSLTWCSKDNKVSYSLGGVLEKQDLIKIKNNLKKL